LGKRIETGFYRLPPPLSRTIIIVVQLTGFRACRGIGFGKARLLVPHGPC
jgi:hypothetical protein